MGLWVRPGDQGAVVTIEAVNIHKSKKEKLVHRNVKVMLLIFYSLSEPLHPVIAKSKPHVQCHWKQNLPTGKQSPLP